MKNKSDIKLSDKHGASNFVRMVREGKKHTQVWQAWVDGEKVITQWGVLGGKIQETVDIPGPKGKPDTKAFVNSKQAARNQIIRDVVLKAQRGYKLENEVDGEIKEQLNKELSDVTCNNKITFDGPLPQNISFSKPVNSIPAERIIKNEKKKAENIGGSYYDWTVKINGMCHLVTKDAHGTVWIQQRGKLNIENTKYPHLIEEFEALLPPKSIMLCELYIGRGYTAEDFSNMQSIANSLPERAIKMQKKLGLVKAYIFRIPAWKGVMDEDTTLNAIWLSRILRLNNGKKDPEMPYGVQLGFSDTDFIRPIIRYTNITYKKALELCREEGFEGWVIYKRDQPLGDKSISFLGNPDRPPVCWKVKPNKEDDFVAIWDPNGIGEHCSTKCRIPDLKNQLEQTRTGKCCICGKRLQSNGSYGTGKNMKSVGSISLYQYGNDGIKRYICEVGSGLTDRQKRKIASEKIFIGVLEIGYQDRKFITRGQDTNALIFPKVLRIRRDKELNECIHNEV
jgi:hypothetical protein